MGEYALVPDGFKLTKVNKGEKQAVKELYKHQDTLAFLENQNTPLLLGVGGLALFTPFLWKHFLQIVEDSGEITAEQNARLSLLFPVTQLFSGVGYDTGDLTTLLENLFRRSRPTEDDSDTPPPPSWSFGLGGR